MDMNVDTMESAIDRVAPISRQIWDAKYRLKDTDGTPVDLTIEDSWRRVARALAAVEAEPGLWEQPFYGRAESCPVPGRTDVSPCSTASSWVTSPTTSAASSTICARPR
jgi:ribonucleotide reductase alpha subunit